MNRAGWILLLYVRMASVLESYGFIWVNTESSITLTELWKIKNATTSDKYERTDIVDKLHYWTPEKLTLSMKDVSGGDVTYIEFDGAGASDNLVETFRYDKITNSYLFPNLQQYEVLQSLDHLLLTDPNNYNSVYFVHGRFSNSGFLTNCFSRTGSLFSLSQAVLNTENSLKNMYSVEYEENNAFRQIKINLTPFSTDHLVNGLSIRNYNGPQHSVLTISYVNWYSQCDTNHQYRTLTSPDFYTNGNVEQFGAIKAACLLINFTRDMFHVKVDLYEPGEDFVYANKIDIWGVFGDEPSTVPVQETTTATLKYNGFTSEESTETQTVPHSDGIVSSEISTASMPVKYTANKCTSTNEITTAETLEHVTKSNLPVCICQCNKVNRTVHSYNIEEIIKDLSINKTTLSSAKRKLYSAEDPRPSAQRIGYGGVILLTIELGFIVSIDVLNFVMYLQQLIRG